MKIDDLIFQLIDVERHLFKTSAEDLLRSLMIRADNPDDVFTELVNLNKATSPHLERIIMDWTAKFNVPDLSSVEKLFLHLRVKNALSWLTLLGQTTNKDIDACLILDDRQGHALPWALIPFWDQFSLEYLERYSQALFGE